MRTITAIYATLLNALDRNWGGGRELAIVIACIISDYFIVFWRGLILPKSIFVLLIYGFIIRYVLGAAMPFGYLTKWHKPGKNEEN